MFCGAIFGIAVGQRAFVHISSTQLGTLTDELLRQVRGRAWASINTFSDMEKSKNPICSDANLAEMRYLIYRRHELFDIGRVRNGSLICTAMSGRLKVPIKLPPPQRRLKSGNLLWMQTQNVADHRVVLDMASHGTVIVYQRRTAFLNLEKQSRNLSVLVLTHDGRYTYRNEGRNSNELLERFRGGASALELGGTITATKCADDVDLCVVSSLSRVNIFERSPFAPLRCAGLGSVAACAFCLTVIRRRRIQSSPAEQVRQALADGRIGLAYQPLVRIRDQEMIGVEALLRSWDERGNPVSPEIIIGVAEESGLIGKITRLVVQRSLTEMGDRLKGQQEFYLSINVSVRDVIDLSFQEYLEMETERMEIPRNRIVLELTERSTADEKLLLAAVSRLRNCGFGMYIDDLGTGYSSLALLSKLPITGIKIDRIFTQSIGKDVVGSTIIEKICSIATALGLSIVIEGVETQQQVNCIRKLHPQAIGQGFFWSIPVSASQLSYTNERKEIHSLC